MQRKRNEILTIVSYLQDFLTGLAQFQWRRAGQSLRERFRADRLGQTAGSLTFTTTIAIVPLFTVILAVFTVFPIFGKFQSVIQLWLVESLIPDSISKQVLGYLTQFTTKASRLGSVSFAALLFSAVALMFTIDRTLNAIWRVRKPRPWHQRLLLYWAAITLGPLIIAASVVMMTSVIAFSGMGNRSEGSLIRWILDSLEFFIFLFSIASLYKYVPNTHVQWAHALVGGLTTNALLELARWGLTTYIGKMSTFSVVYGAFAIVPFLLVWIYTTWVIVLLGAVLVASLPYLLSGIHRDTSQPGWMFELALDIVRLLQDVRQANKTGLELSQLSTQLKIDQLNLEEAIEVLTRLDWVGRLNEEDVTRSPRFVLLIHAEQTSLAPLMDVLLLADKPGTQALWGKWHSWKLSDALN